MLLLTRKAGDAIVIGPDIVVKILEVQGNRVQLGIEAPKAVKIADAPPKPSGPAEPPKK
jgi:carbon storage regulator